MPRNISGVYTLPEAVFVAGTTILSAPVNSDLSDIAIALTQSLASTGVTTMTGPIKAASGSVTAPSYTFGSSTGTGFYLSGVDAISWTAAGILQATFASSGAVTWIGAQTFQSTVSITGALTLSAALSLTSTLSIVTGTEPAITIRNSDNDAAEHELTRYALGSGAGDTASRRIIGTGANDVSQIRDYIGTVEILRQTGSLISPKKNISLDAGITVIATAGYADFTEIAAPAAPAANVARFYSKDLATATILAYQDTAGAETILTPPARTYTEYTTNADITGVANVIADNDNIPQNTEGTQIFSQAITLKKSNSRVRLRLDFWGECLSSAADDNRAVSASMFISTSANALRAGHFGQVTNNIGVGFVSGTLCFEHAPGTVGPHTYTVNVGITAATDVFRLNGTTASRLFGGTSATTLTIEEVYV